MTDKSQHLIQVLFELKNEYLQNLPGKIEKIKKLTQEKKWNDLCDEYHKLKGTGKTYGYPEVSVICEQLELLLMKPDQQNFPAFERALTLLDKLLLSYQNKTPFEIEKDPIFCEIFSLKIS